MKKILFNLLLGSLLFCKAVFAQDSSDAKVDQIMQENISKIRNQEIVVQVLAGQYNKELAELRKMEAIFCDIFKLDLEKWRKGEYLKQEKFDDKNTYIDVSQDVTQKEI